MVTAMARRELDGALAQVLAPPPLPLPGGGELRLVPCGAVAIHDGALGALGFAVAIAQGTTTYCRRSSARRCRRRASAPAASRSTLASTR